MAFGGELRVKPSIKKGALAITSPVFLELSARDGFWYEGVSSDGRRGWIQRDHLLGIWPPIPESVKISDDLRAFIQSQCIEGEDGFCPKRDQPQDVSIRVLETWAREREISSLFFATYAGSDHSPTVLVDVFHGAKDQD